MLRLPVRIQSGAGNAGGRRFRAAKGRCDGADRFAQPRIHGRRRNRLRGRSGRPVLPDPESERGGLLRLRHELRGLASRLHPTALSSAGNGRNRMSSHIDAVMDEAVDKQSIVGGELVVARHGDIAYRRSFGWFDREAGIDMIDNAIYRLASVTKPIVAATALAIADKGLLSLEDPVSAHLDWFAPR